jgi:hypothetical protein
MTPSYDIVIPLGHNDRNIIQEMLHYTKKNVLGHRNIYVISYDKDLTLQEHPDVVILYENTLFPFTIDDVAHYSGTRTGWYFQQLVKLYAGFAIPDITPYYLVVDADTFFLRPTTFFHQDIPLYNYSLEYHEPYFKHMKRLHHALYRKTPKMSGITNYMMFHKDVLFDLFILIETHHTNRPFWRVFLECVAPKDWYGGSGASEYELYFNYIQIFNVPHKIRVLDWLYQKDLPPPNSKFTYISRHHHL